MTNESIPTFPSIVKPKTEWKVKAATYGTFFAGLAGSVVLSTTATDYVEALPDWLESIVYPAILAAATRLSGWAARTRPEELSQSTVDAVERWLRGRLPRR